MTPEVPRPSVADALDVPALGEWLGRQRDAMVADLREYAEHETPSDDLTLLETGLDHLRRWVRDRLGEPDGHDLHASDRYGDALVLDYAGMGPAPLTLLCHYDTVWSAGTLAEWPVTLEGDRLSGPGVFDMKAGLVQAVWALRALDATGQRRPAVRFVLTGDEEIGSPFSRPVIEQACAGSSAVLVFEASAGGAVKTRRSGVGLFDVEVRGVQSHAGLEPEAGVSAVGEMARLVGQLHAAADHERGTSVNVGLLHGGTRRNVVAGEASAGIDVRVTSVEEQLRIDEVMGSLAPEHPRADVAVTGGWNRPVMERSEPIGSLYALARKAASRLGVDLRETSVGGASDGNFAAAMGLPVLDGLGAVGDGAHARHEHVSVAGMTERAALAAAVMAAFAVADGA